jgi:MFS family permease
MEQLPPLATIQQAISLSLSPIFMLAGIGSLLNVLAGRLSRVVDRARAVEALHPRSEGPEHDRHVWELRLLDRRMTVINRALVFAVSSAVMTCVVVALLFVARLVRLHIGPTVAVTFILAMMFLIAALISFLIEVRMSLHAIHIRPELLEKDKPI